MGSTEYLQVLEELLYSKVHPKDSKISIVKLPLYNFITLLVTIYSQFTQQTQITSLNLFILHYFVHLHLSSKNSTTAVSRAIDTWQEWSLCGKSTLTTRPRRDSSCQCCSPRGAVATTSKCSLKSESTSCELLDPNLCRRSSSPTVNLPPFRRCHHPRAYPLRYRHEKLYL